MEPEQKRLLEELRDLAATIEDLGDGTRRDPRTSSLSIKR